MHHGGADKGKRMASKRESIPLPHYYLPVREVHAEEVVHHNERLCRCHYLDVGISPYKIYDICRVVGLHMLNDKIVGRSSLQRALNVIIKQTNDIEHRFVFQKSRRRFFEL